MSFVINLTSYITKLEERMSKKVGDIIPFIRSKNYKMVNPKLGEGAFGKTVIIKDEIIDEDFVCKKYEPHLDELKEPFYHTLISEIKIMYKLYHKNIVRIFGYYLYPESYTGYIIMEYIDGTSIDDYLKNGIGSILGDIDDMFRQIISAFEFLELHKIVHRDIREGNILVTYSGTVKIIDFGLGKQLTSPADNNNTFNSIINRSSMEHIPEEFNSGLYDSQTDMFCIAELFNRLIRDNGLDFKYKEVLKKMMAIKRKDRYKSFSKIQELLNKNQMSDIILTDKDKAIYALFSNGLIDMIYSFAEKPKFIKDFTSIMHGLETILNNNLFENYVQNNVALINVFVSSGFTYDSSPKVRVLDVRNFYDWLSNKDDSIQELVIDNLQIKLASQVDVKGEIDLPF